MYNIHPAKNQSVFYHYTCLHVVITNNEPKRGIMQRMVDKYKFSSRFVLSTMISVIGMKSNDCKNYEGDDKIKFFKRRWKIMIFRVYLFNYVLHCVCKNLCQSYNNQKLCKCLINLVKNSVTCSKIRTLTHKNILTFIGSFEKNFEPLSRFPLQTKYFSSLTFLSIIKNKPDI